MKALKIYILIVIFFLTNTIIFAQTSFNDGLSKANSQNKKVLVSICVESDSWCKKMETVYSTDVIKSAINGNFIFVKLNAQGTENYTYNGKQYSASDLSKYLGATGYPTHVFLNPDGSIIKFKNNGEVSGSYPGYIDAGEFEKLLKYFSSNQFKDTDLSKVL